MAKVNTTVKKSPLSGIGDPQAGFGITGLTSLLPNAKAPLYAPPSNFSNAQSKAISTPTPSSPVVGVSSPSALQQSGLVSAPKSQPAPTPVPSISAVNPRQAIQTQLDESTKKLGELTGLLSQAKSAGYSPTEQIKYDSTGKVIPAQSAYPVSDTGQGFRVSPTASPFAQTTSQLSQFDPTKNETFKKALDNYSKKVAELQDLEKRYAEQTASIEGRPGSNLSLATGQQGILEKKYLTAKNALQNAILQEQGIISQVLEGTGQQREALTSAAGLTYPMQAPYDVRLFDPTQNLSETTGGMGGSNAQQDVSNLSRAVASGQMTYEQALSQLGVYGGVIQNRLLPEIQKLVPGFSPIQSEVLAKQQGQVAPSIQNAKLNLESLRKMMEQLQIPGQTSAFTPLNQLTNWASSYLGFGKEQTAAVQGAVKDVRNALQAALAITGTNPTEATAQSYGILPENPSMANINAAMQVLESLGSIKQQVYGSPGSVAPTNLPQTNEFSEEWL